MSNIDLIIEKLKSNKNFRMIYHKRPDGDTICCSYALALALRSIGAKCEVVGTGEIPEIYLYMTDRFPNDKVENPVNISIDVSATTRLGDYSGEKIDICIDHHINNNIDAPLKLVDSEAAACAEVLYDLIIALIGNIPVDIANFMYTAIVTDTNCFRSMDTRPNTMKIAYKLACAGADIVNIPRRHFLLKTPQRMKIENTLVNSFHYSCEGKVLCGVITIQDMENAGITHANLEGLNSLTEVVKGIDIGVTIRELPGNRSRVSLRTFDKYDASDICSRMGGGGHKHAAGSELDCSPFEARDIVEQVCEKYIKEYN